MGAPFMTRSLRHERDGGIGRHRTLPPTDPAHEPEAGDERGTRRNRKISS